MDYFTAALFLVLGCTCIQAWHLQNDPQQRARVCTPRVADICRSNGMRCRANQNFDNDIPHAVCDSIGGRSSGIRPELLTQTRRGGFRQRGGRTTFGGNRFGGNNFGAVNEGLRRGPPFRGGRLEGNTFGGNDRFGSAPPSRSTFGGSQQFGAPATGGSQFNDQQFGGSAQFSGPSQTGGPQFNDQQFGGGSSSIGTLGQFGGGQDANMW